MTTDQERRVDGTREVTPAWQLLKGSLPPPPDPADRNDILWQELNARFQWYDRQGTRCRWAYQSLRLTALVVGAAVTVLAAISAPPAVTASFAALVVIAEGTQQVFQFHSNWLSYRGAAETLREQAFLYAASLGPYRDPATRRAALASFVRETTAEHRHGLTPPVDPPGWNG